MQISCLQSNLSKALAAANRAVSTRTNLPVTQNILLKTHDSMLRVSATNLSIGVTTSIGTQIEVNGGISVPADLLLTFVNSLPDEKVDMTLEGDQLNIKCGSFETDLKSFKLIFNKLASILSAIFSSAISIVIYKTLSP